MSKEEREAKATKALREAITAYSKSDPEGAKAKINQASAILNSKD